MSFELFVNGTLMRGLAEGRHRDISENGGWRAYWSARQNDRQ